MIIPVPMICDNSLRKEANTTIPLIAKAFERWILLHNIVKNLAVLVKILPEHVKESTLIDDYLVYLSENESTDQSKISNDIKSPASVSFNISDFELMKHSLDKSPTWVKIEVKGTPQLVGVKVFPYLMKPKHDVNLVNILFQKDLVLKFPDLIATSHRLIATCMLFTRAATRMLNMRVPVVSRASNIVWKSTEFGINTLCCFGELSLSSMYKIMSDPKNVRNFFRMGWSGFAMDIVSKKNVMFCTQHLKGTCATVSDADLHTAFDKANKRVYNSVDDLSKAFKL